MGFSRNILFILLSVALFQPIAAQEFHTSDSTRPNRSEAMDSLTLLQSFKRGHVQGHIRYFFMATTQEAFGASYGQAIGGGLRYESAPFKGFQFGIGGFFIYNIGSSNLAKKEPTTGQGNRYEIGLFDVTDPDNRYNIDRMEELYLKYRKANMEWVVGAQILQTPFINEQDGRMRPTTVAGAYSYWHQREKTSWEGGYLVSVSPRSTVRWYSVANSIGVYPQGVTPEGEKGNYGGHTNSAGILLAGLHHQLNPKLTAHVWNQAVLGVFNTALIQLDYGFPPSGRMQWLAGAQLVRQDALGNGGNDDPTKSYFGKGDHSLSFGAKVGVKKGPWLLSLNANRITRQGRYLMPREWGRDPFFTFIPRERSDGLGGTTALVLKGAYDWKKQRLKAEAAFGYLKLPGANQALLNKYGLPSYTQLMVDIRYLFGGALRGFDLHLLTTHKWHAGAQRIAPVHVYNRVNMTNWNLVVNFRF